MHHNTYVLPELARQRLEESARRARLRGWVRHPGSRHRSLRSGDDQR